MAVTDEEQEALPAARTPGKRGCLIALVVFGGAGALSIALSYRLIVDRNAPMIRSAGELGHIIDESRKAPGSEALRALGCDEAGVLEPRALEALAGPLERAQARKENRAPRPVEVATQRVVYCARRQGYEPLECEPVARAYAAATRPSEPFIVTSRKEQVDVCSRLFQADGTRSEPTTPPNLPLLTPLDREHGE